MKRGLGIGFFLLYTCIVAVDLWVGGADGMESLRIYSKPLILLSLLIYFVIQSSKEVPTGLRIGMVFALLCSLAGDILLIFSDGSVDFFLLGLLAFLGAHLIYITIFLNQRDDLSLRAWRWVLIFVLTVFLFGFLRLLWPTIGDMKIPVALYAVALTVMAVTAAIRKKELGRGYVLVLIGAILFVISDSVLAYHTFHTSLSHAHYVIMITYAAAQYMIVKGILRYSLIK